MHNQPDAASDTAEAREDIDEAIAQLEEALATIKRYRHGRQNARSLGWALSAIDTAADAIGWLDISSTWTTTTTTATRVTP